MTHHDPVHHPKHYNSHPSGMECIDLVEMLPFCEGNAIKYLWRADHKGARVEDLKKALWYAKRTLESENAFSPRYNAVVQKKATRAATGFSDEVGRAIIYLATGNSPAAIAIITDLIEQAAVEQAHDA